MYIPYNEHPLHYDHPLSITMSTPRRKITGRARLILGYVKQPYTVFQNSVIRNIKKVADLSDFDNFKSLWLEDYKVDIGKGAFDELVTCSCYKHVLKVVYG